MNETCAVGVFREHCGGVLTALCEPVEIELELHQCGVGVLHEFSEAGGVALWLELVVVIVEGEGHAGVVDEFAPGVELCCGFAEAFGGGPEIFWEHGADHVLEA